MMRDKFSLPTGDEKETIVQKMFSSAARRYDLTNTFLSFGLHHYWKRVAASTLGPLGPDDRVLDLCAGTADLAIIIARRSPCRVIAVDLNEEMLTMGKQKVAVAGLSDRIAFVLGNAEMLEFANNTFRAVTVAFGIRNVANKEQAFAEILRVLVPGGRMVCLEFSIPQTALVRRLYDFYSFTLLPLVGAGLTGDKTGIYNYLPASIRAFPYHEELKKILENIGFRKVTYRDLSCGIVSLHTGIK